MDSGPRTSPEAPGLGPAIAARVRPRLGIGRRSPLTRVSIGGVARTIAGFGRSLGLARSARPVPVGGSVDHRGPPARRILAVGRVARTRRVVTTAAPPDTPQRQTARHRSDGRVG